VVASSSYTTAKWATSRSNKNVFPKSFTTTTEELLLFFLNTLPLCEQGE